MFDQIRISGTRKILRSRAVWIVQLLHLPQPWWTKEGLCDHPEALRSGLPCIKEVTTLEVQQSWKLRGLLPLVGRLQTACVVRWNKC